MHDPKTVAHEIRSLWKRKPDALWPLGYRPSIATIWHRDPEKRGDDDSCDWFHRHLSDAEKAAALQLIDNEIDNLQPYFKGWHRDDIETALFAQWRAARRFYKPRPWWRHPRWHVHHWTIQVHWVQAFQRWAFSRCASCGGRFPWGYAPVADSWHGTGPRWFRGESGVRHHECSRARVSRPRPVVAS